MIRPAFLCSTYESDHSEANKSVCSIPLNRAFFFDDHEPLEKSIYLSSCARSPLGDSDSPSLQHVQRPWFLGSKLISSFLAGYRCFLGHWMTIFTSQHAVLVVTLMGTLPTWWACLVSRCSRAVMIRHSMQARWLILDPEARPLSKLLRASHTVTGQNQCMVHAHGVCVLGALQRHLFVCQ